jgi:hypothetical protein
MKDNTCNYSDEWQPYIGDYDKFEYDIKLKDGTIVENCYPNGGKFNSISNKHDGCSFSESLVSEIRFSQNPRFGLNEDVSNVPQYEWLDKQSEEKEDKKVAYAGRASTAIQLAALASTMNPFNIENTHEHFIPNFPKSKYKEVSVRTEPKIGRNEICPKCDSGKKYKKCCINKTKENE